MSDLLDAEISAEKIALIVVVSRAMVFNVEARKHDARDLERKSGSGGHNKICSDEFLMGVAAEIKADLTIGIRKLGKDLR